jgi:hypothetical protein
MKKVFVISLAVLFLFSVSLAFSADVWPPKKGGLLKGFSCVSGTDKYECALYTKGGGTSEADCRLNGGEITVVTCNPDGYKQICDNGAVVRQFDAPAVKCKLICAPQCNPWK